MLPLTAANACHIHHALWAEVGAPGVSQGQDQLDIVAAGRVHDVVQVPELGLVVVVLGPGQAVVEGPQSDDRQPKVLCASGVTRAARDQGIKGSRDQGIKRSRDQGIKGSRDQGIRGSGINCWLGTSEPVARACQRCLLTHVAVIKEPVDFSISRVLQPVGIPTCHIQGSVRKSECRLAGAGKRAAGWSWAAGKTQAHRQSRRGCHPASAAIQTASRSLHPTNSHLMTCSMRAGRDPQAWQGGRPAAHRRWPRPSGCPAARPAPASGQGQPGRWAWCRMWKPSKPAAAERRA
jgi:hypothetical protein